MEVLFDDDGVENGDEPFTCDCAMQPAEPLTSFDGELSDGEWELSITDSTDADDGTLDRWCVNITEAENAFLRGDTDGNGAFFALLDAIYALTFAFGGGDPPPAPHPDCGLGRTASDLDCAEETCTP